MGLLDEIENSLEELHRFHLEKALKVARFHRPNLSREDLLNPDDFPEVIQDPRYAYEDGLAAGVLAAKVMVRSLLKGKNF